jgi:hypothetical protein
MAGRASCAGPSATGTLVDVPESVFEREDVDAILRGLWDIKVLLVQIARSLGNDEEEEEEEA